MFAANGNDRGAAAKAKNGKMTGGHYAESVVGPAMGVPGAVAAPHAPQQMVHASSSSMVLPAARPPGQANNTLGHASPVGALELGFAGMALEPFTEQVQASSKDAQIAKLVGTLAHYRAWAAQIQARYQMFNPDAARPARRIYVGGLPPDTADVELRQYINELMVSTGGCAAAGFPIASCKIYPDKSYAFLEFRSVEEASNCMAFDGVAFRDSYLRVRRPNNYDMNVAVMLGPTEPDPTMDLTTLDIVKTVVQDSPDKLFIGGLPCDWSEDQVKELLLPFGQLKAFNLVMDKNTGNSKGYAFCEFQDISLTDYAIQNLNGKQIGNKFLTVKRALQPGPVSF